MTANRYDAPAPLAGLVLAGGRSVRMGEDKAGLVYTGCPQARYVYRMLEEFCERVYISDRHEQSDAPGHDEMPHIFDLYQASGPLNGILSAFAAYPGCAWLVVACDLPCLDQDALRTLQKARAPGKEATTYRTPGAQTPEPYCTIYEPAIAPRLLYAYRQGHESAREVLQECNIQVVEPTCTGKLDDVNDPEARAKALADLGQEVRNDSGETT